MSSSSRLVVVAAAAPVVVVACFALPFSLFALPFKEKIKTKYKVGIKENK